MVSITIIITTYVLFWGLNPLWGNDPMWRRHFSMGWPKDPLKVNLFLSPPPQNWGQTNKIWSQQVWMVPLKNNQHGNGKSTIWRYISYWNWGCPIALIFPECFHLEMVPWYRCNRCNSRFRLGFGSLHMSESWWSLFRAGATPNPIYT